MARRPVRRPALVVLALMFFFMATLVNGQQGSGVGERSGTGEPRSGGPVKRQSVDAGRVPAALA